MKKYNLIFLFFVGVFFPEAPVFGQYLFDCSEGRCSPPSSLTLENITLSNKTLLTVPYVDDTVEINNNSKEPHDFNFNFFSKTTQGINLNIHQNSRVNRSSGANVLVIGDSVRNLNFNNSGFSGGIHGDASRICAERIVSGDYGSLIRNNFNNRRNTNPSLPLDRCVSEDLLDIQNNGEVNCGPDKVEVLNQTLLGSRWAKMRECHSNAGRAMCVAKRLVIRCELYQDRPNGFGENQCCNSGVPAPSLSGWVCDPIGCSVTDSGWKRVYSFRMWESEYSARSISGQSNEYICNELIGISGDLQDEIVASNVKMVALAEYTDLSSSLNIFPPSGLNISSIEVSAGECGSFSDTPNSELNSFSEWFRNNSRYVRMRGEGRKIVCEDDIGLHPVGSQCHSIIQARNDSNQCFGNLKDFPIGNQCFNDLVPACSDDRYETYEPDSYCRNNKITKCIDRPYQNYDPTEAPFCYNLLKERQCGGIYSDWPVGSKCWQNLQPACSGIYTDHATGSFCRNKLSPECSRFDIEPEEDPDWTHPLINDPDFNYCMTGSNIENFPENCNPFKVWSTYPVGSKCWSENQSSCPLPYNSYENGSYCYEKNKPECLGEREDYSPGSFCYQRLTPEVCTGEMWDHPLGSFCYLELKSQINCSGDFRDYPFRSYCYETLKPTCDQPFSSYSPGSYCSQKLQSSDINGEFQCLGSYTDYQVGSYCFTQLTRNCEGLHTDHPVGSFCYNNLFPGQSKELTDEENCTIISGIGSLCWKSTLDVCVPDEDAEEDEIEEFEPGSYCWYVQESEENGYCYGSYSDYPKGSECWFKLRGVPELHYYSNDICSIRCQWNGAYASCNIGTPDHSIYHIETSSVYKGQSIPWDSILSFRVRFKVISEIGLERNVDNEVKIKIKNPNY